MERQRNTNILKKLKYLLVVILVISTCGRGNLSVEAIPFAKDHQL